MSADAIRRILFGSAAAHAQCVPIVSSSARMHRTTAVTRSSAWRSIRVPLLVGAVPSLAGASCAPELRPARSWQPRLLRCETLGEKVGERAYLRGQVAPARIDDVDRQRRGLELPQDRLQSA